MNIIEINAVSCSRKGKYDAEIQLKYGAFDDPTYKQVLVSTGHGSSQVARLAAQTEVDRIEKAMIDRGLSLMSRWPNAKP